MKKKVLLGLAVLIVFTFLLVNVLGAEEVDSVNRAMACLDDRVEQTSLSLEEAVFASLANTAVNKTNDTINSEKSDSEECWPKSGCDLKTTAQVAIAKLDNGENISNTVNWLKSKSGVSKDLTWYLQISSDSNGAADCVINYNDKDNNVDIGGDMKLGGNPGNCLVFADTNYRMEIRDNCLDVEFSVSCNESFKTNLIYRKTSEETTFVSSETHSAAGGAWAYESITAKCFKQGNDCNYEGSLWATTVLYQNQEDISDYSPYLRALANDNQKYFPSAFLVAILAGGEDHYANIANNLRQRPEGGYWEAPNTAYGRYYDTSLAMLAFGGGDSSEIRNANALNYLFENQDESGCWNNNNLRDTAFIIYAAKWFRSPGTGGGTNDPEDDDEAPLPGTIIADQCNNGYWGINESSSADGRIVKGVCHLDTSVGGCCPAGYRCDYDVGNESESICVATGGGYDPDLPTDCEVAGYYCGSADDCLLAGGRPFDYLTHSCSNPLELCCPVEIIKPNCELDLGGQFCLSGEACTGSNEESSGGTCCVSGTCESEEECGSDLDCESGYVCESGSCVPQDEECFVDDDCESGFACEEGVCVEEGSNLWFWIILLLVLIALVVLGIIYRDKLKIWWFNFRSKGKKEKKGLDIGPPGSGLFGRRPTPRFIPQRPMMGGLPPQRSPVGVNRPAQGVKESEKNSSEKERDETFKKLREMSK